jgi:hypothetical protein
MKVLRIFAIIYFISLIILISKTMEDPSCINSITVQSINIERDQESVFVPSCYFEQKMTGTPVLGDKKILKSLSGSIESFEKIVRNHRYFFKLNSLKIVVKDTADLVVSAKEIQMNREQAKDPNLVRKSLLKSWFLNFASQKIKDDKFTQEIVSDIFLYVFWNEISWEKETNFNRWLKYIYSEKGICKTKYAPSEREPLCGLIAKSKKFDQISIWSMRPIVVNRILYYYDQMNLSQKLEFSKYWMKFATTYNGKLPEKNLSFYNFSNVYNSYMEQFVGPLLNVQFEENLFVDFVFEFKIPQLRSIRDYQNKLPAYMQKNVLFKFSDNTFFNLRNGSKISSDKAYAKHWVLVQNSFPELKDVKTLSADYLTIIQAKKDYDFSQFYKNMDNISAFPWTDDFDSLTIYIPSLKLLGRLAPEELKNSDIRTLSLNPKVPKILGWNPVQVY